MISLFYHAQEDQGRSDLCQSPNGVFRNMKSRALQRVIHKGLE